MPRKKIKKNLKKKIQQKKRPAAKQISSSPVSPADRSTKKVAGSYTAKDITVLEGLDPVRKRPGMYIGGTSLDGLHHLIWEVVDNSIDEAMAGYCTEIEVILHPDNAVSVADNGRGIPVEKHKVTKKSALETVMCTLHAGGKFGGEGYKVSGGLHGVGVSVVNALSRHTIVEVKRDGFLYRQEYQRGQAKTKVKKGASISGTGTKVTFNPDPEIFKEIEFSWKKIVEHLRQQAYLTKNVRIKIIDQRQLGERPLELARRLAFYFEGGIRSYLKHLNASEKVVHENPFYVEKNIDNYTVEVALQYTDEIKGLELSFANNIHTGEGGTHVMGFRSALTRVINDYARKNDYLKAKEENLTGDDVREGLSAVISVKLRDPQFEGQTKAKLGNAEMRTIVQSVCQQSFSAYLEEHPQDARQILGKCLLAQKARQAAKAAKDTVIRKGALDGLTLPGKLADCSSKKAEDCELYIVEGDSAGGSAKQGRDRNFQAIFPLRGKILNIERARLDKVLSSKEIKSLIIALGTGVGEGMDLSKLRYHRIIIMTDADVDGAHIRTLLLTLFYRHFEKLVEEGHLYIAQPPLFKVQVDREMEYAYTDEDKEEILNHYREKIKKGARVNLQRYKGLGEMNPRQLWETTMDPQNRTMYQVKVEEAAKADLVFDTLMGAEVEPRRRFIQTHAKDVQNLDV